MKLGILTGLQREVSCLAQDQPDTLVVCAGANAERAESLSRSLIEQGCGALLSFGVAGALSPHLKVGDVVVASHVCDADGVTLAGAENWRHRVCDGLPKTPGLVHQGILFGSDRAITSAQAKREIYETGGALCVDMETHRMARVSAATSTPFLAIRIISDDAGRILPSAALGVIGADGRPKPGLILRRLLQHPGQIPDLIALSRDMETAVGQLRRVSSLIGPLFRFA